MSRVLNWLFLLSLSLTLLSSNVVFADDADADDDAGETAADETYDDEEFDDEEDAVSSSDITVKTHFPEYDKKFPLGKKVTLLVSFNNNGEKTFNVSKIAGHLHSPFDYNYYIQNFTVKDATASVGPNQQVSLSYTFTPDIALEPLEFWFSAYVTYNRTDGRGFMHTLHNGTIELVEASDGGSQKLIMYVVVLAGLGILGYVMTQAKATKAKPDAISGSTGGASWDDDEIYTQKATSKRAGGRKGMKKKN